MNRLKSLALVLTLILLPLAQIARAQPQSNAVGNAAKVKAEVAKRLANHQTRVKDQAHEWG